MATMSAYSTEQREKNLLLWNKVSTTDPTVTKAVKYGSREFTSVDPHVQLKNATTLWGPYGKEWGVRSLRFESFESQEKNKKGEYTARTLVVLAEFFCPFATFEYCIDHPFRAGDDTYKKAITSFRSKCLSLLGFNSDVFEGLFDDVGYVRHAEFVHSSEDYQRSTMLTAVENCQEMQSLKHCRAQVDALFSKEEITKSLRDEVYEAMEIKRKAFVTSVHTKEGGASGDPS